MAFEFDRNLKNYGFVFTYFEEVDMQNGVLYGVELEILEHCHALFSVDVKFDSEDLGGVDEFAYSFFGYNQISGDQTFAIADFNEFLAGFQGAVVGEFDYFAAVEDYGNFLFAAESLGGFLAEVGARLGAELEYFHCFEIGFVLLKIKLLLNFPSHGMLKSAAKVRKIF